MKGNTLKIEKEISEFLLQKYAERRSQLSASQLEKLDRIYPNLNDGTLIKAIDVCDRNIGK